MMIWETFPVDAPGCPWTVVQHNQNNYYLSIYLPTYLSIYLTCVCVHVCYLVALGILPATRLFFG